VEVEAYESVGDEACHTFFRPSTREFVAEHLPGAAYVYLNYGMHWLFNVLVKGPRAEGFVLVRALEPTQGLEEMRLRRGPGRDLCGGPGKLTQALGILGEAHGADICAGLGYGLRPPETPVPRAMILADVRVGITKAADYPWRYLLKGSKCLSVRAGKLAGPI
jgi:DNA-3-methyladenine glycosylase